jgi:hypothetical protein
LRTSKGAFGAGLALAAASALAAAVSVFAPPSEARAGVYHVYSCRTPSGELAPADGWSTFTRGITAVAEDTCAAPAGGLVAALVEAEGSVREGDIASWVFTPAAGETLAAARVWRAGDADGGFTNKTTYEMWLGGAGRASAFDECVARAGCTTGRGDQADPLASANELVVPRASLASGLSANAGCSGTVLGCFGIGAPPHDGYEALAVIYAADLTLEQRTGPGVADVGGALATAPAVSGASAVTFTASDAGAGAYEALVSVDGTLVQRTPLDSNGGRCRDVGGTSDGSAAFLYEQPCVASVSADVMLDTTPFANGAHHVQVSAIDAAGNAASVLDRTVTVANPSPCANGVAAPGGAVQGGAVLSASWHASRAATLTTSFGRAGVIDGSLTQANGAAIPGVPVEIASAPVSEPSAPATTALARTDAGGRFSVKVSAVGPSRRECVAYRGPSGAGTPLALHVLALAVRAPVKLAISPRVVNAGRTIHFSGRLLGGHVPAGGKQVILEARSAGSGWLEFKVVRSNSLGRFRASYRFRFPGPATYEFRALCEAEGDYPFARGASNAVRVHER